jgi:hypothetical protein
VEDKYVLVSVGKLVREEHKDKMNVTHWISDVPLLVAGFNYGQFKKRELVDRETQYKIEGYAVSKVPDYLRSEPCLPTQVHPERECGAQADPSPTRLTEQLMVQAQNAIRIYSVWFGNSPYERIAVTQQPQFNFGQSWPTLIYLPIISFLDSTQRWMMLGLNKGVTDFIQEVTPHEVAHQWWGHLVGWSSYHDQWLSEGFADFSASLYLQLVEKDPERFLNFWETSRKRIVEKNQFGVRPNDAGPIWLGTRLITRKTADAYNQIVYSKGAFILHMLRQMMYDPKTGDERFVAMMKDFVQSNLHQNATSERFKSVVEKHMQPTLDLDSNGRMNWFFREWVYETALPSYLLEYKLTPQQGGKVLLTGQISQSGVPDNFKMIVPIYLEFESGLVRLGNATVMGNSTVPNLQIILPKMPKRVLVNAMNDVLAAETVSRQIK